MEDSTPADRYNLIKHNIEKIETCYVDFFRNTKETDVVVLVCDLRDPIANMIAEEFIGEGASDRLECLHKFKADVLAQGMMPTTVVALRRTEALELLDQIQISLHAQDFQNPLRSPVIQPMRSYPESGKFYVVALSFGKSLGKLDIPIHWIDDH